MSESSKGTKLKALMKLQPKQPSLISNSSPLRQIHPLGYRVVVKILKEQSISEGGLFLPEGAKQNMQESLLVEVIEVASARDDDSGHETNVSGVPLGAMVLIPKEVGVKVPWDDSLRIVDTQDVLAVVSEITMS